MGNPKTTIATSDKAQALESLKGLEGLSALSVEDYNTWKNQQLTLGKLKGTETAEYENGLYTNQLFIQEFGLDTFKKYNKTERDAIYRNFIIRNTAKSLYAGDPNYDRIMGLSDDSLLELMNSNYFNENTPEVEEQKLYYGYGGTDFDYTLGLADAVERRRRTRAEDTGNPDYQLTEAELKEVQFRFQDTYKRPEVEGDILSATASAQAFSYPGGVSAPAAMIRGGKRRFERTLQNNQELLDQFVTRDIEAVETEHYQEIIDGRKSIIDGYNSGKLSYEDIEAEFQAIMQDSNYYKAFRDAKELEGLTLEDKADFIAKYRIFKQYKGETVANQSNEMFMQNYISDAQSGWDWFKSTQKNILVGGTAHLANTGIGLITLYKAAQSVDGSGELTNYLQGLDAEGNPLNNWINPQYWNGVDMFNTFSAAEINRARENGGISQFNAIQRAGDEYKFFSWYTANEALKMSKYVWSIGLQTYLTGGITSGLSGMATRAGLGSLAKGISTTGNFISRQLASLPMAVSMGVSKFNDTRDALNTIIDQQVAAEVEDYFRGMSEETLNTYVNMYLNSSEFKTEMEQWIEEQKSSVPEGYVLNMSDEELRKFYIEETRKSIDPIEIAKYYDLNTAKSLIEGRHADSREAALKAATKAYMVQATVSQLKESLEFKFIDNWMLAPSVRHLNNADVISRVAYNPAAGYTKTALSKFQRVLPYGKQFLGQGLDEGFDGVSEGLSQGFGLGYFNNITGGRYNPESYIASQTFLGNLLTGAREGWKGAVEMATDEGTIYEALIGAISPLIPNINVGGILSRFGISSKEWNSLSKAEKLSYYISNPLLQELADQNRVEREADEMVEVLNATLRDNKENLLDISSLITATTRVEDANLSHDILLQQDAQAQQLFELAYTLKKILADPMLSQAEVYGQTLERMQRYAGGNIDEDFITAFVGRKENEGISREEAKNRIQHQAQKLVNTYDSIAEAEEQLQSTSSGRNMSETTKKQLIFNKLFDADAKSRLETLEKEITGSAIIAEEDSDSALAYASNVTGRVTPIKNILEDRTADLILHLKKAKKTLKFARRHKLSDSIINSTIENIAEYEREIADNKKLIAKYKENISEDAILSKEEILSLSPSLRATMLDLRRENQIRYSEEQQKVIKELAKELKFKDPSLLQKIQDSGELYRRRKYNQEAYNKIIANQEVFEDYAAYMEDAFQRTAHEVTTRLLQDHATSILRPLQNEQLKYAIIENHWGLEAVQGYLSELSNQIHNNDNPQEDVDIRALEDRMYILQRLAEVVELHSAAAELIKKIGKKNNRGVGQQNALMGFIYNLTKNCNNDEEAISLIEDALANAEEPEFKQDLEELLNGLVEYGFQRNALSKVDREERAEESDEKVKEEEEKLKEDSDKKSVEQTPQKENDAANAVQVGEAEDVDLDISPSIEQQSKESGNPIHVVEKDTTDEGNEIGTTALDIYIGNPYPGFEVDPLIDDGTLIKKKGAKEGDTMNVLYKFLEDRGIKLQDIIDFELGKILKKHPDIKVRFMMFNQNDDNFNKYIFNVVEYTPDIKKLHDESRGGVITTADGKQWLVIGMTGTSTSTAEHKKVFFAIKDRLATKKIAYFNTHSTEQWWISDEYTQVKEVQAGRRVRKTPDTEVKYRTLSELMYDENGGFNEESNPKHIGNPKSKVAGYSDLSWYIQKGSEYIPINTGSKEVLPLNNPEYNNGSVFLLIEGADGKLVPNYIQPIHFEALRDGKLKQRITKLFTELSSKDFNRRLDAKEKLKQFLLLTDEDTISIGKEGFNAISIIRNGSVYKSFNLDTGFDLSTFITAISEANFRVNITASVLSDVSMIAEYDEAGALTTDVSVLALRNASYTTYTIGPDGKPIITDTPSYTPKEKESSNNEVIRHIQYGSKRYRVTKDGYRDELDRLIIGNTPENKELIKKLQYSEMVSKMEPSITEGGNNWYIIDDNPNNPVVVMEGKSHIITIATKEEALETIRIVQQKREAEAMAKAAQEALNKLMEENPEEYGDVDLGDEGPNIAEQMMGNFGNPPVQEVKTEPVIQQPITPSPQPKKDINDAGNISLENLETLDKLTTFAELIRKSEFRTRLKTIFNAKGWSWGKSSDIEALLKSKGVNVIGIDNLDNWFDLILNCK